MPFAFIDATGPVISAKISGELDTSEVRRIQDAALQPIRRRGRISALFMLENFTGWKPGDDWGDITFMSEHDADIAKIAVVGRGAVARAGPCVSRQGISLGADRVFSSRGSRQGPDLALS